MKGEVHVRARQYLDVTPHVSESQQLRELAVLREQCREEFDKLFALATYRHGFDTLFSGIRKSYGTKEGIRFVQFSCAFLGSYAVPRKVHEYL